MAQLIVLDSGSENNGSSRSSARYSTPGGDGGRFVAWQGPPEGQVKPVSGVDRIHPIVGARKTCGLNSAGQLKLRDRVVEVRAGATSYA